MESILVYLLLALMGVCLVSACIGIAAWAAMHSGGPAHTRYTSKIFAGVSYLCLGLSGVVISPYITDRRVFLYILAWAFMILGGYLLRGGLRLRREIRKNGR